MVSFDCPMPETSQEKEITRTTLNYICQLIIDSWDLNSFLHGIKMVVCMANAMVVPSILGEQMSVIMIGGDVLKSTASIVGV